MMCPRKSKEIQLNQAYMARNLFGVFWVGIEQNPFYCLHKSASDVA